MNTFRDRVYSLTKPTEVTLVEVMYAIHAFETKVDHLTERVENPWERNRGTGTATLASYVFLQCAVLNIK